MQQFNNLHHFSSSLKLLSRCLNCCRVFIFCNCLSIISAAIIFPASSLGCCCSNDFNFCFTYINPVKQADQFFKMMLNQIVDMSSQFVLQFLKRNFFRQFNCQFFIYLQYQFFILLPLFQIKIFPLHPIQTKQNHILPDHFHLMFANKLLIPMQLPVSLFAL